MATHTSLIAIDWNDLIERMESLASSELGRSQLRETAPLASKNEAIKSFEEIEEAQLILNSGRKPRMESLDLFSTWADRLKRKASLKILEIKDVRRFLLEIEDLRSTASGFDTPWLKSITESLLDPSEPLSAIDQIISPAGEIRSDASELLAKLFQERKEKERSLHSVLNKIVKQHNLESVLQDRFVTSREGRWVIPVKSGMRHDFEGIIHDMSHTKQTVFMEPKEAVQLNNQIRDLDIRIEDEIEHLLTELSLYLSGLVEFFEKSKIILQKMDVKLAQAAFCLQIQGQPCDFDDSKIILQRVRHPGLVLKSSKVVPNTVELDRDKRILLLSGPNAGGKTVLLKSIGLACHMARCGLLICADVGSSVPFFKDIHVAVGDEQSVDKDLSTFAAHLQSLTHASQKLGPQNLLLIDEIFGATDPEEGAALARSFIEHFGKNKVFAVITSHLGPLKENWNKETGVLNGRLEYDEVAGKPTYRLYLGLPGQSQALKMAKNIGVPNSILERALNLLHPDVRERHKKLDELEAIKIEMQQTQRRLEQEQKEFEEKKKVYAELIARFKKDREKWLEKTLQKAQGKVDKLIQEAQLQAQQTKALNEVKSQIPQLIKTSDKPKINTPEQFATAFPTGSMVYIKPIGQDGIVQSEPDNKGMVTVLSNSMRLQISFKDLEYPRSGVIRTPETTHSTHRSQSHLGEERHLDFRGQRVEAALSELELQLDLAIRNKEDRLKIIHGHGTDALKKSIRTYLSRSVYVRKWRAGDVHAGGDGVTWVELMD